MLILILHNLWQLPSLQRYEKDRKAANVAMIAVLDGFQKMYSVDFGPLNVVRAAACPVHITAEEEHHLLCNGRHKMATVFMNKSTLKLLALY
jgi:2-polyprenyl-6-methoxyphenol hydroxylase-like FAD-dependent oxidoreductase